MNRSMLFVAGIALATFVMAFAIISQPTLFHALLRAANALWRSL